MSTWTPAQRRRLQELGEALSTESPGFTSPAERDRGFQRRVAGLEANQRERLSRFRAEKRRPALCLLEQRLAEMLAADGFVQVATPIIMAGGHLARMGIGADHPLHRQVFWLDGQHCLRPMLAPHLYYVSRDLLRLWERPVGLFEIGPCFRRETDGAHHAAEFTMLNLVEYGLPEDRRRPRLEELAGRVAAGAGLPDHRIVAEQSDVYGQTLDVVAGAGDLEIGSAAMGPHPLDEAWGIRDTWVGIGFGLERLLLVAGGGTHLARMGRSLAYLDGTRLNLR
jgi:pyrrolysyl-tRNA synthetase-like protein